MCTAAVGATLPPRPSLIVSVAVKSPACAYVCVADDPFAGAEPSPKFHVNVTGSLSGSVPLPVNAIDCPTVPLYGPPAVPVGARFAATMAPLPWARRSHRVRR